MSHIVNKKHIKEEDVQLSLVPLEYYAKGEVAEVCLSFVAIQNNWQIKFIYTLPNMIYIIKAILYDIVKYVKGQMANTPAYVQVMRDCFSKLWDDKNKCLRHANKNVVKDWPDEWVDCVNEKLESVDKNIAAQKEFRFAKLVDLCAKSEELKNLAELNGNGILYSYGLKWRVYRDGTRKVWKIRFLFFSFI
jgi:hypothetical protein